MLEDVVAETGRTGGREALGAVWRGCEVLECGDIRTEIEGKWVVVVLAND